jgi:hypothetical protein
MYLQTQVYVWSAYTEQIMHRKHKFCEFMGGPLMKNKKKCMKNIKFARQPLEKTILSKL